MPLSSLDGHTGVRLDAVATRYGSYHVAASAGAINGDAFGDMIIGAWSTCVPEVFQGSGAAYMVFGSVAAQPAGIDTLICDSMDHPIDGGSGTHTLRLTGHGLVLGLTALPQNRLVGIDIIDLSSDGNNTLGLNLGDVVDLSDSAALRIDGNARDFVFVGTPDWQQGSNQILGSQTYASCTLGGASLLLDLDITQSFG